VFPTAILLRADEVIEESTAALARHLLRCMSPVLAPRVHGCHFSDFSPLTTNNTSHSRASSMHLIQWLNQASAVGSLLGELPGQSIQKICLRICIGLR
jgi:hypothetical protein